MSTKSRKSSIAAFLFMPQFGMSFQGLRDMAPIFVRTFALILAQTGLIPNNHPATRFSEEGISEYSFRRLLGEAWFTLRTTKATPHQWGVFTSIILMICVTIVAVVSFVLNITFNLGAAVQAQIFTHPGSPYGSGSATDIATMQSKVAGASGIFDFRISGANVSVDYALMVLDKALRQGAVGAGGSAQNAFGSLMLVYNTAVLVIAGIILFWLILSVVVDTAKTGQIGGGRHNMVWAPIRIIFALGLMIPLGSAGFSSGQFMVMKLAEWGSNLATRGWAEYISRATTDESLIGSYMPENPSEITQAISYMMVCQAANNFYTKEATVGSGAAANLNYPGYVLSSSTKSESGDFEVGYTKYNSGFFSSDIAPEGANTCGALYFADPAIEDKTQKPVADGVLDLAELRIRLLAADKIMKSALVDALKDNETSNFETMNAYSASYPGGSDSIIKKARELACAYVRTAIPAPFPQGMNTIPQCLGVGRNACGSDYDPATKKNKGPDARCVKEINEIITNKMKDAYVNARDQQILPYIRTGILQQQEKHGWAAMGVFFYQITKLNEMIKDFQLAKVKYNTGYYTSGNLPGTMNHFLSGTLAGQLMGYDDANHDHKVMEKSVMFSNWWKALAKMDGKDTNFGVSRENKMVANEEGEEPKNKKGSWAVRQLESKLQIQAAIKTYEDITKSADKQPIVQLTEIGSFLTTFGFTVATVLTIVSALAGLVTGGAILQLFDLVYLLSKTMIFAGLILLIYIPLVPIIRVGLSIFTWIVSVFEAVVMVPIAALAHLSTEGEGLAGGAKQVWYLWLNVLLRPILTVVGFIGAFLIFNTVVLYFNKMYFLSINLMGIADKDEVILKLTKMVAHFVIYVFMIYTIANSSFKLIDQIPNALAKWIGGQGDPSFDDKNDSALIGSIAAIKSVPLARGNVGGAALKGLGSGYNKAKGLFNRKPGDPTGASEG